MTPREAELLRKAVRAFMREETPEDAAGFEDGMEILSDLLRGHARRERATVTGQHLSRHAKPKRRPRGGEHG